MENAPNIRNGGGVSCLGNYYRDTQVTWYPVRQGELPMDTQAIIAALDKEISRLQQARAILTTAASINGAASIKRDLAPQREQLAL
jgi:hypothetical protein